MKEPKHVTLVNLSYECIARILNLPDGVDVISVFNNGKEQHQMRIGVLLKGDGLFEVGESCEIPYTWEIPQKDGPPIDLREKYGS